MEDRVEYDPSPQKRTMTREEFARALAGGDGHDAKRDLIIAQYVLAGVTETLEHAAQDDLPVMAEVIERMHADLLAVRELVLRNMRDSDSTRPRLPDRPVLFSEDALEKLNSVRRGDQNEVFIAARSPDDSPETKRTLRVSGLGEGEILAEWYDDDDE